MALPVSQNFEGGTNATTITTTNTTGTGNTVMDDVTTVANGTLAFDSANVMASHGTLCLKVATGTTAGNSFAGWTNTATGTTAGNYSLRYYFKLGTMGAATTRIASCNSASGVVAFSNQVITSTRLLTVTNSGGTAVATTTTALTLGTWYRIECQVTPSTTVGQVQMQLFVGDAATATETVTTPATQNFGTGLFGNVRFGVSGTSVASAGPYYYDDCRVVAGLSAIGPSVITATRFRTISKWR